VGERTAALEQPVSEGDGGAAEGRVVLVTGGSRGIGLACARAFATNGDRVAVLYRTQPPPDDDFLAIQCDVTDGAQVDAAFGKVESELGGVRVLVSNAGITRDTLLARMSPEDWSAVIDTNLTGAYHVSKRAIGPMMRARFGRIVFVSSVGAYLGGPGQANYSASKAGLIGLARSIAREYATRGITANVVTPGPIDTDMTAALGADGQAAMAAAVPVKRLGTSEEVAAAICFLASTEAAYVTGVVLPVDGGLGMGH
jgi:3-oxoacyl-[acyl-carrier protein] reductase